MILWIVEKSDENLKWSFIQKPEKMLSLKIDGNVTDKRHLNVSFELKSK